MQLGLSAEKVIMLYAVFFLVICLLVKQIARGWSKYNRARRLEKISKEEDRFEV